MSIEALLKELAEAVNKNTAAVEKATTLREEAIEQIRKAAETAPAPAAKAKPAPAKKAEAPAEAEEARQITESPEDRKPVEEEKTEAPVEKAAAVPSLDDLKDAMLGYMQDGVDDKDERAARKAKVVELLGKVKATKHTEVPENKRAAVINALNKLKAQGNVLQKDEAEEEDLVG